jgi:alcohol dehydrogenase
VSAEALVLAAPRRFERRRFALRSLGDSDGLLRVEACGLCGTDHEQYTGHIASKHAFVPGHEVIGTLEAFEYSDALPNSPNEIRGRLNSAR